MRFIRNKELKYKLFTYCTIAVIAAVASSCGTGIEDTTKVSEKDVKKVVNQYAANSVQSTLKFASDSVANWHAGKRFYVSDNQARLIFSNSAQYSLDTLRLEGKYLTYEGYETGSVLDNHANVILKFSDGSNSYSYNTNKTLDQLHPGYVVPFLIDDDMVKDVARQIEGKTLYTRTRIWYDATTQEMIDGRQFIAVKVDSVLPGNKVLPLRVVFTTVDTHQQAMLRMASGKASMKSRDFDSMFSLKNPHSEFPDISPENWTRITIGVVVEGMNKLECRLAKGAPKTINRNPSQDGMREYWYYDGGSYLYFADDILRGFRK